ncbi:MAG: type I restriction endonuclease [Verrucomicrobiota bacterium]
MSLESANREAHLLPKEGIKVSEPDTDSTPHTGSQPGRRSNGRESARISSPGEIRAELTSAATDSGGRAGGGQKTERLRVVDWEHPANNDFLLVSQFSVTGALSEASAFILLPCPGLVVIELRKPDAGEMTNADFRLSN